MTDISHPAPSTTPSAALALAQTAVLARPRRRPGALARLLFATMDRVYGKALTLERFEALELIARVPYQAWESVGYVAITHTHERPRFARRIFDYVRESRAAQDNEQWHLFILEELVARAQRPRRWLQARVIPQLLALFYYHISWLLYVIAPQRSYALNADFEDHAEHAYMQYVAEHPELAQTPWVSAFKPDYGAYASVADVLRRIALDEGEHRDESLARIEMARFTGEAAPRVSLV